MTSPAIGQSIAASGKPVVGENPMKPNRYLNGALLLLGTVTLAACNKPAATSAKADTSAAEAAIKADIAKLVEEFNAKDAKAVVAHDAPDEVSMFHGTPNTVGPEADLMITTKQMQDPLAKVAVSNEKVDVAASGEMAVYRAEYAYTMTDTATKKPVVERGNWLVGYKTQADGSWKIAWNVVSNTANATEQ